MSFLPEHLGQVAVVRIAAQYFDHPAPSFDIRQPRPAGACWRASTRARLPPGPLAQRLAGQSRGAVLSAAKHGAPSAAPALWAGCLRKPD